MKKILLLLANGFEAYEASVFSDILDWNMVEGDGSTKLVTCGVQKKLICTGHLTVMPELLTSEVDVKEFDALAIPGGYESYGFYKDAYCDEFLSIIQKFSQSGKIIAAICVGALPLGKSGVLCGRQGTTYHLNNGYRQQQLASFGVNVVNQAMVIDGNIITSSSPATALDVSFKLLEMLTSSENCRRIKHLMGF
ncbi:4-methyl-5(b-hydroxyethyl)-thiazole monophosphate biosynthesis [Propionispira arboris]|uniref:4-methyl-5(B-hydroxyethyl)-thiazole monophosphate biosynthesis n=1 Tax=Propionispira arboris TaxID=84035 RepID=A0A1H6WSZ8_9FIRM|nr:DJ-1/PfpI family protein [Propionispira arboris]SEJ18364.1 4-methyl-5(b-hydroxyethyl)-thiazole monophosphate biosynthesis [Propionispira arboris]